MNKVGLEQIYKEANDARHTSWCCRKISEADNEQIRRAA